MGLFPSDDPAYAATYAQEAAMVDAAEVIAEALAHSGIKQTDLADLLGVNRSEITARLRGERNITVRKLAETLHALGAVLRIEVDFPAGSGRAARAPEAERLGTVQRWLSHGEVPRAQSSSMEDKLARYRQLENARG